MLESRPTEDGVLEDVCVACGSVVETSRLETFLDSPPPRQLKQGKRQAKTMRELLTTVDPTWAYLIPRFFTQKDPNPVLSSLFHNPFTGVWDFKDRTKPSRKSFKVGFDEVYCLDRRRTDKYQFHRLVRELVERAMTRFAHLARRDLGRRKGLFAACLYVEAMLQISNDIRLFNWSQKSRHYVRMKSVWPKGYEKWASCFNLSEKTIVKRILEIEQEIPEIGKKMNFVRHFEAVIS